MDKVIKRNIVSNLLTQGITFVVPLVLSIYTARVLNVSLIGKLGYVNSILTYFTIIAEFGITTYGVFSISECGKDDESTNRKFWELFIIKLLTSFISLSFYLILIFSSNEYKGLFSIGIISLVASATNVTWYYQGKENFKFVAIITLLSKVLELVAVIMFVRSENDFILYAIITFLTVLLPNLLMLIPILIKNRMPNKCNFRYHLKPISQMFFSAMLVSVYSVMDKSMIVWLTGLDIQVGYYEQALKVYNMASVLVTIVSQVLSPRVSKIKDDSKALDRLYDIGFRFVFLFAFPIFVGLFILSGNIILMLFGNGYEGSIPILKVFAILPLFVGLGRLSCYIFINPFYKQKFSVYATVAGATTNFLLNIFLCLKYGAFGTALATLASEILVSTMNLLYFNRYKRIKEYIKSFYIYLFAAGIMGLFTYIFNGIMFKNNIILSTLTNICISCVVYFTVLLIFKETILANLLKKIMKKER